MELTHSYIAMYNMATRPNGTPDFDKVLAFLNDETELELYSLSIDWYRIGPEFILKAKGGRGDVLVSWI